MLGIVKFILIGVVVDGLAVGVVPTHLFEEQPNEVSHAEEALNLPSVVALLTCDWQHRLAGELLRRPLLAEAALGH
jgi:hypothetical protein